MNKDKKTGRQALLSKDGIILERKYIYLTSDTWLILQKIATDSNTSISQVINNFANNGAGVTNNEQKERSLHTV